MQKSGAAAALGLGVWMLDLALQLYSSANPDKLKPHPYLIESLGFVGLALILFGAIAYWREREKPKKLLSSKEQKARDVGGHMIQAETVNIADGSRQQTPFNLEIEIKEITFCLGRNGRRSMFLWVKILLKSPEMLSVNYSLAIVSHGVPSYPEQVNDLGDWLFRERSRGGDYSSGPYRPTLALPISLESGVYAEGWLHFIRNEVTDAEIGKSLVRLRVNSSIGKIEKECPGITVVGTRYIMRRRIDVGL